MTVTDLEEGDNDHNLLPHVVEEEIRKPVARRRSREIVVVSLVDTTARDAWAEAAAWG